MIVYKYKTITCGGLSHSIVNDYRYILCIDNHRNELAYWISIHSHYIDKYIRISHKTSKLVHTNTIYYYGLS